VFAGCLPPRRDPVTSNVMETSGADARLIAFAGHAIRHAIDSAIHGAVFIPFLWWHDRIGWHVFRFLTTTTEAQTAVEAEVGARTKVRLLGPDVHACAFVHDGYTTIEGVRHDAAYCRVSLRNPPRGLVVVQPYELGERRGVAVGDLRIAESVESWLG